MEIQTTDQLDFIIENRLAWQQLVEQTTSRPFFAEPAYQAIWWKHLGHGHLRIMAGYEAGHVQGLAPFFVEQTGKHEFWRLIGAVDVSDYLDLLVAPEKANSFFSALADHLTKLLPVGSSLKLESIKASSLTRTLFSQAMKQSGWQMTESQQDVCPVITLPETWEEYLDQLPDKTKRPFKRLLSVIGEEDDITYSLVTDSAQMPEAIATFITLHKASGLDKREFWTPPMEHFFQEMTVELAKQGVVKLYFLEVNGQPAASLLLFDYGNEYLVYNSGFDAYRYGYLGVGNALFLYTIREAIRLKKTRYDFMRGDEAYKFSFGAVAEPLYDLTFTQ